MYDISRNYNAGVQSIARKEKEGSEHNTIISSVSRNFPSAIFLEVRKYQLLCDISLLQA